MREIKFRAWDIRNSKMVENALQIMETQQLVTVNADYFNSPFSFFDGCKWMQFTGMKDKNNKEVFEGDIFQTNNDCTGEVKFLDGGFVATHHPNERFPQNRVDSIGHAIDMEIEIIGNIYQNPELIKQ